MRDQLNRIDDRQMTAAISAAMNAFKTSKKE
jgi:hypothetical protein